MKLNFRGTLFKLDARSIYHSILQATTVSSKINKCTWWDYTWIPFELVHVERAGQVLFVFDGYTADYKYA